MKTKYIIFSLIALAGHACWGASWEEQQAKAMHLTQKLLEKHKKHNYNPQAALVDAVENNIPEAINYLVKQGAKTSDLSEDQKEKLRRWGLPVQRESFITNPENLNRNIAAIVAGEGVAAAELSSTEKIAPQIETAIKNGDKETVKQLAMVALTMGDLPDEMTIHIAKFLDRQSLISLAQVNKKFNAIVMEELAKSLLEKHKGNLQAALFDAAINNYLWAINYLVKWGANVNEIDNEGYTALINAAKKEHANIFKAPSYAMPYMELMNEAEDHNCMPLISAARHGHSNMVALLLRAGANINSINTHGVTALMRATQNGHNGVIAQLIRAKADVNAINAHGMTALMLAVLSHGTQIVQTLLDGGAKINLTNNRGKTALDIARQLSRNDTIQILENWVPRGD